MSDSSHWARLLAFVTGLVNQELLLQNEYLVAENRILRAHLPSRLRLSDPERCTLAEIGKRLGRKGLNPVACAAKPDTILGWYRQLIARKFDGSRHRAYPGRPRVSAEMEKLVVRFARENSGWGYDRIVGALANLGSSPFGSNRRQHPSPPRHCARTETKSDNHLEGVHPPAYGRARRNGLLYGGGANLARLGYILRSVLPASGDPARHSGRHNAASNRRVDDANRPECH